MSKLKKCVVFDLDDTLCEAIPHEKWEQWREHGKVKQLQQAAFRAKPIPQALFVLRSFDFYMTEEPADRMLTDPVEFFFITARPEILREDTVQWLALHTGHSSTTINKRLIMNGECRADKTFRDIRIRQIATLKERGYIPSVVLDDNELAVEAYKEKCPEAFVLRVIPEVSKVP